MGCLAEEICIAAISKHYDIKFSELSEVFEEVKSIDGLISIVYASEQLGMTPIDLCNLAQELADNYKEYTDKPQPHKNQ